MTTDDCHSFPPPHTVKSVFTGQLMHRLKAITSTWQEYKVKYSQTARSFTFQCTCQALSEHRIRVESERANKFHLRCTRHIQT